MLHDLRLSQHSTAMQSPVQKLSATGDFPATLDLVYFRAGGGHLAAARALQARLAVTHPLWRIRLVDLFQVLDPDLRFRRLTGFAPEAYYNKRLATGFTLGLAAELRVLQAMIRAGHDWMVERLVRHWERTRPDGVVSLVPNFNRSLGQSLQALGTRPAFVTVMTDLADYPPHFWVEPGFTDHLICGTDHAVEQALLQGMPAHKVHRVEGMMLAPGFHHTVVDDRAGRRRQVGLDAQAPVGIVMFGGHGSRAMLRIAAELDHLPLILLCGHNDSLRQSLAAQRASAPRRVLGFTDEVVQWMRMADFFIGKPGPGSISEALHCGLPVVVTRNAWTMPQERWNTEWIRQTQLGVVLPSFTHVRAGVDALLAELALWHARVAQFRNRALLEVPGVLQQALAEALEPHSSPT